MPQGRSEHAVGVVLVILAAIAYSTAGLFTKGVAAGAWEVIFWRGVFAVAFSGAWALHQGTLRQNILGFGRSGWAVAVIGALGTAAFIPAFKLTSIANVALIYAVAPLVAAALAWIFIGERPSMRTTLGGVGALFGMSIIVSGSLGGVSLRGDLLALCMTIAMAAIMVIYRKYPSTPSAGPTAMQSVLLLPFCFVFGQPLRTGPTEIAVLAAFGLFFALAAIALAEGSKRVSSGQTALLCTLETPLAPLLALLLLAEVPANATLIGGFIVLVAAIGSIHEQKN